MSRQPAMLRWLLNTGQGPSSPSAPPSAAAAVAAAAPSQPSFFEQELVGSYTLSDEEKSVITKLTKAIDACSTAFGAVVVASILLGVAQASAEGRLENAGEASTMLFSGLAVGDVSSWVDSLLMAALLRFCNQSFKSAQDDSNKDNQLAYVFQASAACAVAAAVGLRPI